MRSRPLRTASIAFAVVLATATGAAHAELAAGDRAAELSRVVDRTGKKISLRAWRDRVVVMTFGASWCVPCKRELPAYEKLAAAYAARHAKVVFLAINIDTERAKGRAFVDRAGLRHVVAGFDAAKTSVDAYDPGKMPTTFVLRGGIIRAVQGGYAAGDERRIAAVVDRELAKL
jgi:thiol-disulfide isomerase/thioredoxin